MFRFTFAIAMAISLAGGSSKAHDYARPDLDNWYRSLHRKGLSFSCCSKQDCHTTEAELRDGVWWARLGTPVIRPDGRRDWILGDYVRIPDELIVRGENGLPVLILRGKRLFAVTPRGLMALPAKWARWYGASCLLPKAKSIFRSV